MTTYFGIWKLNTSLPPQDPKVELQLNLAFQAMIKQDISDGTIKEAYTFLEGSAGYFLSGDVTEEKLHEVLITFELHKTIPILKSIETVVNVSRARVAALKVPA